MNSLPHPSLFWYSPLPLHSPLSIPTMMLALSLSSITTPQHNPISSLSDATLSREERLTQEERSPEEEERNPEEARSRPWACLAYQEEGKTEVPCA
jgi:hypothetical protein